ncbi:DNA polymerase epsilon subunit 3 [Trichinella pseudospiralis]|uniref:DNA polymerase epsilon subunit 3 n=1 Tax=Trichinella pseudospiralis TaxID=6337 RepID=A0A0V1JN69_TRIPS|nr:DNA polymerase epsilon subunit 3 [Trichinella pseudospiralis]
MAERMEDLNIPLSAINRILNSSPVAGNLFTKESRTAISRATSIFVLYLTSIAHAHAIQQKRKTINVADVLQAAKDAELDAQALHNIAEMMNSRKPRSDGPSINGGSSMVESTGSSELRNNSVSHRYAYRLSFILWRIVDQRNALKQKKSVEIDRIRFARDCDFENDTTAGFGIAERLVNITIERCPDAAGSENRPRPCITAFTRPSVKPDSIAEFSWVRHGLEPSSICTVQFAGQQGIYKLSPDVGPHPQCSSVLSTFRHRLASVMGQSNVPAIRFQPFHQNQCPIRELPLDYNQYLACTSIQTDQWYLFRFATEATPPSEQWFLEFVTLNPRLSITANNSVNFLTTYHSNQCQLDVLLPLRQAELPFSLDITLKITLFTSENKSETVAIQNKQLNADQPWIFDSLDLNETVHTVRVCYNYFAVVDNFSYNRTVVPMNFYFSDCINKSLPLCIRSNSSTLLLSIILFLCSTFVNIFIVNINYL